MGFEAPWALLAVLLAGAPIAIHLLKRRDLRTVSLPTIALLREAQAQSRQRMRLADILLLLLRIAALALLLGCLARPYSVTTSIASADRAVTLAIVLDDSASMAAESAQARDVTVFDSARDRIDAALAELPAGSEVVLVLAGTPPVVAVPRTADLAYARARVAELGPGGARADLHSAMLRARRELSGATSPDLRMLVLTDLRQGDLPTTGPALPRLRGVAVQVVPLAPQSGANVSLRDVLVTAAHDAPEQLLVQLTVARTPTDEEPEPERAEASLALHAAILSARGETLAETDGRMDGGSATLRLTLARPDVTAGPVRVVVHAEGDIFPADDERVVDLGGRAAVRVAVVNGSPHPSPHLDEVTFLRAALEAVNSTGTTLDVAMLDAASIEAGAVDALDVLVLANVASLTIAQGARLEAFVRDGGGVLVTSGDQVQVASYAAALPRCMPGRLEPASAAPAGALVGESPFTSVSQPDVRRRLVLGALEPAAEGLLRFADGTMALAGRALGAGRCAALTTSVDLAWGDLALAPEFVGLVQQTLRWLLGVRQPTPSPRAGEPAELALPSRPADVSVTTPDGRELPVASAGAFTDTRRPGRYLVKVDGQPSQRLSFTVGVEPLESDLRAAGQRPQPNAQSASADQRARRQSWVPLLLLLAALALVAEGLLRVSALRGAR